MSAEETGIIVFVGLFYLAIIAFFIVCYWKIWSKAGFHGAWSLLMLVPLANFVAFAYLAFAEWPIHKKTIGTDTFI